MAFKIEDNSWPDFHNLRFSRHFVQSRNKHYSLSTLYLQPVITQYFASNKSEIWS